MLLVPRWEDHIDSDQTLPQLVDALLAAVGPLALRRDADVRPALAPIVQVLAASAAKLSDSLALAALALAASDRGNNNSEEIELDDEDGASANRDI